MITDKTFRHVSVLKEQAIELLGVKESGRYFDGTLGGGGHSEKILSLFDSTVVYATDLDERAIAASKERLKKYADRLFIYHDNFKNFAKIFDNGEKFDGILLDLGVSSPQLDDKKRGFSYLAADERLNMKMDESQSLSAYEVVNFYEESRLEKIFREYGEERFSRTIAKRIVEERKASPIETCGRLVEIIDKCIPYKFKRDTHPAKKTFQAIRIEVNGELDGLDKALYDMADKLKQGGTMAVITFHSLEDRIVKNVFKDLCTGCVCDRRLPVCVCNRTQKCLPLTKKPIVCGEEELKENPRAKSAKLRAIKKI